MQVDNFGNTRIGTMDLFVQKQKQAQNKTAEADDAKITLGNTTHTKKEWEDMMRKLDRYLEMVKEEQKTRLKQQQKQAEEKKIYARLDQKARDQKKRLLKKWDEQDVTKKLLAQKERYMATPEELAEGEYEISSRDTGTTYKFQSNRK